jgi:hypothetical protein
MIISKNQEEEKKNATRAPAPPSTRPAKLKLIDKSIGKNDQLFPKAQIHPKCPPNAERQQNPPSIFFCMFLIFQFFLEIS